MKKVLIIFATIIALLLISFVLIIILVEVDDCGADYDCALEKFGSLSFETNKAHSEII